METAETNVAALKLMYPMQILTGLDGHGVAAIFDSGNDGPTVLFRAELDALPIQERNDSIDWPSDDSGKSHVCGYDGHMTMLLGLGRMMSRQAVARGRVVLMFQPAEEDGGGAKAVVAAPAYQAAGGQGRTQTFSDAAIQGCPPPKFNIRWRGSNGRRFC